MKKFIVIIAFIPLLMACGTHKREGKQPKNDTTTGAGDSQPVGEDSYENNLYLDSYTNESFNFRLKYPENWRIVENDMDGKFPVVNIFDSQFDTLIDLPISVHARAELAFISIFPKGFGTDLPSGQSVNLDQTAVPLDIDFSTNRQESTLFKLQNDQTWGFYLVLENTPSCWQDGFIFAQISTNNFSATCFEEQSGEEIAMEDCDPMTGDRIVRKGEIDQQSMYEVEAVLESFQFMQEENEKSKVTEMIEVEKPLPNQDISSPLTIKGKARGMWYFEGDFPVELVDKDGNKLAEAIATAKGNWMTEDFVPFSATMRYNNPPDDERGYLVFHRSNASGLPKHDMEYRQPVLFPPKVNDL